MKLSKHESIIAAFGESCSGPGWGNQILNVIIRDGNQQLRIEYLQPEEWTKRPEIIALFDVSEVVNNQIVRVLRNK